MTELLGVEINLSKSLQSDIGVMEFAKRLVSPNGEYSPLGPGNIVGCLRHPAMLPSLFLDYLGKGGLLNWSEAKAKVMELSHRTDLLKISRKGLENLIWTIIGPFGMIPSPGVGPERVSTSLGDFSPDEIMRAINTILHWNLRKDIDAAIAKSEKSVEAIVSAVEKAQERGIGQASAPSLL